MSEGRTKGSENWSRETGYRECVVSVRGQRAKRVHYHDPEGFDKMFRKYWDAFYAELCIMPDPQIPVKEKKSDED